MNISVIIITKNVADLMEQVLVSVEGLWNELLVGDQESIDGTIEIAKRYHAKVILQKGLNFGQRKLQLVEKAKGDWIFILDADERASLELKNEIYRLYPDKRVSLF